jgi:hypothetical protein
LWLFCKAAAKFWTCQVISRKAGYVMSPLALQCCPVHLHKRPFSVNRVEVSAKRSALGFHKRPASQKAARYGQVCLGPRYVHWRSRLHNWKHANGVGIHWLVLSTLFYLHFLNLRMYGCEPASSDWMWGADIKRNGGEPLFWSVVERFSSHPVTGHWTSSRILGMWVVLTGQGSAHSRVWRLLPHSQRSLRSMTSETPSPAGVFDWQVKNVWSVENQQMKDIHNIQS